MTTRSSDAHWALPPPGGGGDDELAGHIADEIADHLEASAAEYRTGGLDAEAARRAALSDFGDPTWVAAKVRSIHLGGQIMFQKITIAALLLLTLAVGVTAYFSYAASRSMAGELRQLNTNLTALATRSQSPPPSSDFSLLAEKLDKLGQVQLPTPRLRIYVYDGSQDRPMRDVDVSISGTWGLAAEKDNRSFTRRFKTDKAGLIDPGPMPRGSYQVEAALGSFSPSTPRAGEGRISYSTNVQLVQEGQQELVRIDLGLPRPRVRLVPTETCSWDLSALPQASVTVNREGYVVQQWVNPNKPFQLLGLPRATTVLDIMAVGWEGSIVARATAHPDASATTAPVSGELPLKIVSGPGDQVFAGQIYRGSPDHPVKGMAIRIVDTRLRAHALFAVARTLDDGRFGVGTGSGARELIGQIPVEGFDVPLELRDWNPKEPTRVDLDRVVRLTARFAATPPLGDRGQKYSALDFGSRFTSGGTVVATATADTPVDGTELSVPALREDRFVQWDASITVSIADRRAGPFSARGWCIGADGSKDILVPLTGELLMEENSPTGVRRVRAVNRPVSTGPNRSLELVAGQAQMVEAAGPIRDVVTDEEWGGPDVDGLRYEIVAPNRLKVTAPAGPTFTVARIHAPSYTVGAIQSWLIVVMNDGTWQRYDVHVGKADENQPKQASPEILPTTRRAASSRPRR